MIDAIKKYLSVLESNGPEDQAIELIMASLDELAFLAHSISYAQDDNDYPDPPGINHKATMEKARKRFPSLGFYNVAGDISDNIAESEIHVGDAISDIAEIADDLANIIWYFENTSLDNAKFYYQLGFRSHWGWHLRSVQLYLHDHWW